MKRDVYTTGMILSSEELSNFVHFPDGSVSGPVSLDFVKGLRVPDSLLQRGRPLGFNSASGGEALVTLPDSTLNKCFWLLGASRTGKSTSIINQVLWLSRQGHGVVVIDPHRSTALELLGLFDEDVAGRVVFLDFDCGSHVPCYNCFSGEDEEGYGRLAVEVLNSFKTILDSGQFHRMSHLLGMGIYALFVLEKNISALPALYSKTGLGERLRGEVIRKAGNEEVKRFWKTEFNSYPGEAFSPVLNRLSTLFIDTRAYRVFSQEKNKIDIGKIMNEAKILVVAMPASNDVASLIGGMVIAQVDKAAQARTNTVDAEKNCFLFVDEAHRFLRSGATIETILNERVKGGLHTCLANQETGQLSEELLKAVLSAPNVMCFSVNMLDAKRILPVFRGKVSVENILSLRTGEAIGRIDTEIVDFKCPPPPTSYDDKLAKKIIRESRERYYTPLSNINKRKAKTRKREFDTF